MSRRKRPQIEREAGKSDSAQRDTQAQRREEEMYKGISEERALPVVLSARVDRVRIRRPAREVPEAAKRKLDKRVLGVRVAAAVGRGGRAGAERLRRNVVKVARIAVEANRGDVRRLLPPHVDGPVHGREERMALDLVRALAAEPLLRGAAQGEHHVTCRGAHARVRGHAQVLAPVEDLALRLRGRLREEGRVPKQHLEHDDPHRPPVARLRVARSLQHFGRNVVGRADERVRHRALQAAYLAGVGAVLLRALEFELEGLLLLLLLLRELLVVLRVVRPAKARAEAKVRQLDVPVLVDENVVGLNVAVAEAHLVHRLDCKR
eukprot:Opistho-1_new@108519